MANFVCRRTRTAASALLAMVLGGSASLVLQASDHSDAPPPRSDGRPSPDANITDLHAFLNGSNLVLAMSTNPAIPKSAVSYVFPVDVTFEFNIDVDSAVDPADPNGDGGTVVEPHNISEDVTYRIRFRDDGSAQLQKIVRGAVGAADLVGFFAGLRDDPFIRGPRQGRNVGAIVLEVPLSSVTTSENTLLIWATSKVEEFEGTFQEIAGRSLRSMFIENAALNRLMPKHHLQLAGLRPDVMIYDTSRAADFPNGRALTDDVVDDVGDPRVLGSDAPFPSANDVPFLADFPYLAPPHAPQ